MRPPTIDEYLESIITVANEARDKLTPTALAKHQTQLLAAVQEADKAVETVLAILTD